MEGCPGAHRALEVAVVSLTRDVPDRKEMASEISGNVDLRQCSVSGCQAVACKPAGRRQIFKISVRGIVEAASGVIWGILAKRCRRPALPLPPLGLSPEEARAD
jgi:hypothetical protein